MKGMGYRRDGGGGCEIGWRESCAGLRQTSWVEHSGYGVNIGGKADDDLESQQGCHPGIGGDHEDAELDALRAMRTQTNGKGRMRFQRRGRCLKDGFGEKGKPSSEKACR